ncbi:ShlB/FhaC/HecB family hemolysin secretion/activation protein [Oscillatoria sp. FACHB-1406]|uniref:ShlB/FhaC/HecB family hemolysin secretion/activation protein n=1 Tax=Oscillatoria sp. FACHB-1406 TaxID=2692846 RepID=UPI00168A3190|nr:ShlB/FhaC/HecB family hemolysin secretion/activation protein [Oscillatoria sp. FACHB-1406]MBD2577371.1 ShlB/FhaC/HecB family hemolysin secretion/activation protein [Oscillatoria sp. FACHB-1406]
MASGGATAIASRGLYHMTVKQFYTLVARASLFCAGFPSTALAQFEPPNSVPQIALQPPTENLLPSQISPNQEEPLTEGLSAPPEQEQQEAQATPTLNFPCVSPSENDSNCLPPADFAQTLPPPGTVEPPPSNPTPLPDIPEPPAGPFFPSAPPSTPPRPTTPGNAVFRIRAIEVLGSTVFSQEELQAAVSDFIGKEANYDDLLEIRSRITQLYVSAGYATSGAFLPPQELTAGIVRIQIAEGRLERIEVRGLERLRESYVRSRIEVAAKPPLNVQRLETALQLLQQDGAIERVNAELAAGTAPGLSILSLQVKEAAAFSAGVIGENTDSPSVGENSVTVFAGHNNFAGYGDRISARVRDTKGLTQYSLGYEIPITPYDGTFSISYSNSRSKIIEPPFADLNIRSESDTLSFGFRHPLYRTPRTEVAIGATLDLRQSQTYIFNDIPFSFSLGPEEGHSKTSVLRLSQEWVERSETRVLAARSQFNFGLNWLNATINNTGVDGDFITWNGQFQWVEAFSPDTTLVARIGTQIAFDSLLSLEQFSVGGDDTVRGYRRNQRVGDSGFTSSVELRFTVLRDPGKFGVVQLVPFIDYGMVWNYDDRLLPNPDPRVIASTGVSLRWQLNRMLSARLDWGVPLIPISTPGTALQDRGITFSIRFQPF